MIRKISLVFFWLVVITLFISIPYLYAKPITMWITWEGEEQYKEIAKNFTAQTGIEVKTVFVPKLYQKLRTIAQGGGDLPDIALIRNVRIGHLADEKIIKPLPESLNNDMSQKGEMAFSYNDKLFGLPFYFDVQITYYNPILIKKTGLPEPTPSWTFYDLENYGKRLKKIKGIVPFGWGAYTPYYFAGFEYSFKKDCIKCDKIEFFSSATEKAILFYKKLIDEGIGVSMDRSSFITGFKDGKIGFIISGSFMLPDFIKEGVTFKTLPLPINPETKRRVPSYLDYKGFVVFKKYKKGDNVYKFLSFLKREDVQYKFCKPLYKFPDNKKALSRVLSEDSYLSSLEETVKTGIIPPKETIYTYYDKAIANILRLVLAKNVPINKAFAVGRKYLQGKEK